MNTTYFLQSNWFYLNFNKYLCGGELFSRVSLIWWSIHHHFNTNHKGKNWQLRKSTNVFKNYVKQLISLVFAQRMNCFHVKQRNGSLLYSLHIVAKNISSNQLFTCIVIFSFYLSNTLLSQNFCQKGVRVISTKWKKETITIYYWKDISSNQLFRNFFIK